MLSTPCAIYTLFTTIFSTRNITNLWSFWQSFLTMRPHHFCYNPYALILYPQKLLSTYSLTLALWKFNIFIFSTSLNSLKHPVYKSVDALYRTYKCVWIFSFFFVVKCNYVVRVYVCNFYTLYALPGCINCMCIA